MEGESMKYPAYPKYKKSGVEWLGDVPEHWGVKRLKFILQEPLQYGANEAAELDDPGLPRFVRITDVDESGNLRDETFRSLPEEIAKPFLLDEGDLLFARSGATVGKTFFYRKTWGKAAYAGYLIRARLKKKIVFPDYVNFITKSSLYAQWISSILIQATIQNVSAEKYASYLIPIPPLAEQQVIANFLDSEAGRIDELIGKKQKLIELLKEKRTALISHAVTKGLNPKVKMKPSGVEWLGAVPDHWNVKRMKHLGAIRYGLGEPPEYVDEGLPFIRATDIKRGKVEMDLVKKIRPEDVPWSRNPQLKLHEILVVRSGAYTGDSAIITSDVVDCIAGYDMVYTARKAYAPFMAWVLLSKYMLNGQIYLERMRAAQPHLNAEELGNFIVLLPSLPEQQTIADFLDHETGKIDSLISKVETAIEKLKEYRTALISAAVTGKIDVSTTLNTGSREVA
jgi:type I restriction enzyme S subunit